MSGEKSKPVIGILTGSLISGNRSVSTSPRTPSPKAPKSFDLGAVGLGIVAALEKSGEIPVNKAVFSRNSSRSSPIPVKNCSIFVDEMEDMSLSFEDYTIVTRHGPNESVTKVYGDGRTGDDRNPFRIQSDCVNSKGKPSVFHISPVRFGEIAATAPPPSDFLSACNMCYKKLHNKDIFMYRGEKAFCSEECRYSQIAIDERKEKESCGTEATTLRLPVEVSGSPYTNGPMFNTGIFAI